ncbi:helix-turn-helix domain-containing protein [Bradyrhizobium manausense]|uniref:helix-turn-helix domain-containing protein n=1 Tax=Bradyrhizobium manausense TaxID=989370 RepID=UPI001BA84AFB|nr:helix-turn-helix domain-containing protein [Bradyrhizobium manausense]MBR0687700.1 helix-turn-helix domain-containing protein [Bradyrhizobium manausense]
MIPKGTIRLSEAFDRLCASVDPEWSELPDLCARFDEWIDQGEPVDLSDDPYRRLFEVEYRAERLLRWALADGELRAFVHNLHTGVDLELPRSDWSRMGENVGIRSDYTDERTPGPDCRLDGVSQPIFLSKEAFENWLGTRKSAAVVTQGNVARNIDLMFDTRAFSLDEVIERTGLSRTKLYEEIELKHLVAKKCGNRTLVLESDLNRFLQNLPSL